MRSHAFLMIASLLSLMAFTAATLADEQSLLQQAQAKASLGDIENATALYSQAVQLNGDSSPAWTGLGGMQLVSSNYQEAIQSFQKAIGLDNNNYRAFIGMSMAYLHQGRYGAARASLTEARRLAPPMSEEIDPVIAWIDNRMIDEFHP